MGELNNYLLNKINVITSLYYFAFHAFYGKFTR